MEFSFRLRRTLSKYAPTYEKIMFFKKHFYNCNYSNPPIELSTRKLIQKLADRTLFFENSYI